MVKVRFAPSPTGYLHIGGARTALFNWMYSKAQGGKFVLRVEDTDKERSKKEFLDEILNSMQWLGLNWDELYLQGERFDIYRRYAKKLLDEGKAYKDGNAIILKMPLREVKLYDVIRGEIQFDTAIIKDQVLIKSNGSPAYSFACVVDDALMEISHVIRGEDHIPNTPKQIIIYEALGFKVPKFAHLPLILGEDGSRMSKRTGAVAVSDYKAQGFLPEALVNYLMLLGWAPGADQEIVKIASAVKKFSIKKINKASAVFSMDKLKWVNAQYIKDMDVPGLVDFLAPLLIEKKYIKEDYGRKRLERIVKLYQRRFATISEFLERTDYLFLDEFVLDEDAREKHFSQDICKQLLELSDRIEGVEEYDAPNVEKVFRSFASASGAEAAELVHPVRIALTGKTVGPGLFETMEVLGKGKTIERLKTPVCK
jgi:glutamyl-tRNA synthetase